MEIKKNVGYGVYVYTGNYSWSYRNGGKKVQENLESIPDKHTLDTLQKTAILRTSHITRKVLQSET
jgi:hypothetical protein